MKYLLSLILLASLPGYGQEMHSYRPTGKFDTVRYSILVSIKPTNDVKIIDGWAIREIHKYYGDPMPPGNYRDYEVIVRYLDERKKPLPKEVIVWMAKEVK